MYFLYYTITDIFFQDISCFVEIFSQLFASVGIAMTFFTVCFCA